MIFSFPDTKYETEPFGHCVVRGAWDDRLLGKCKRQFDTVQWPAEKIDPRSMHKRHCSDWDSLPLSPRVVINTAHSPEFLAWLEQTTGERELVPDPHLYGGGLHRISVGGYLNMHRDFNRHPQLALYRRLNLLLYLNDGWQSGWGGNLILGKDARSIAPESNTMVVFTTDDNSWHGHPHPLTCPAGVYRDSIALYYYSANKADNVRTSTDYQ